MSIETEERVQRCVRDSVKYICTGMSAEELGRFTYDIDLIDLAQIVEDAINNIVYDSLTDKQLAMLDNIEEEER